MALKSGFRLSPKSGSTADIVVGPVSANSRHRYRENGKGRADRKLAAGDVSHFVGAYSVAFSVAAHSLGREKQGLNEIGAGSYRSNV